MQHAERAIPLSVQWPGNRLPITILLDDPTPCRNPAWYEFPDQGHVAVVPNSFTEHFADIAARTGAAGKFSVVPCPGAQGRIDEEVPGVSDEELAGFLSIVRERIAPRWDISPEMLTHNKALDLATMQPLEEREDVWAAHQDEATLTAYIARGLEILRRVGLEPNGVTSPWAFGKEVEDAYANAIVTALREVCGVHVGWYFLDIDSHAPSVPPRVMRLDPQSGTALTSLITAAPEIGPHHYDFAWRTQHGEPARIDALLTADGQDGRLATLYAHGSPMLFHTHWQSLFSNGTGAGLDALRQLCERINHTWGERIRWMAARELAQYCAAREATTATAYGDDEVAGRLTLHAPFPCAGFTFSLPCPGGTTALICDGVVLEERRDGDTLLDEGTWRRDGARATICLSLRDGVELAWT